MKNILFVSIVFISACVSTSGKYTLTATWPDGTKVPTTVMAQGAGIYPARDALCEAHPGATVKIIDSESGEEFTEESPHQCS